MKLHLGCGQRYLKGYVNIDQPVSKHTVQKESVADLQADILGLRYVAGSIEEIRLHHVFEHFPRPVACALLASWFSWLRPGGTLRIEVPDFRATARRVLSPLTSERQKMKALRHIFGSHEANWAVHCAGYTPKTLTVTLEQYGFIVVKTSRSSWRGTYNVDVTGQKRQANYTRADFFRITREYLEGYLIDSSETENRLLEAWLEIYLGQLETGWAR